MLKRETFTYKAQTILMEKINIPSLRPHQINDAGKHIEETDPRPEFLAMEPYCRGLGLDIGCGTNRLSPTVLSLDSYPHKEADIVWDCVHGNGRYPYPFQPGTFDFIFASHVLEDFAPYQIQWVFDEWLRMVKPGGYLIILVPDMEGGRYPDWDEKFTEDSPEVVSGERKVGDLKGNPSHKLTMGTKKMQELVAGSQYKMEVVQYDTIPHDTMTLDFVIKKL